MRLNFHESPSQQIQFRENKRHLPESSSQSTIMIKINYQLKKFQPHLQTNIIFKQISKTSRKLFLYFIILMSNILIYLKQLCSDCFRESRKNEADDFSEWLVESKLQQMQEMNKDSSVEARTIRKASSINGENSPEPRISKKLFTSSRFGQSSLRKSKRKTLYKNDFQDESFYSIDSKCEEQHLPTRGSLAKQPEVNNRSSGDSIQESYNYDSIEECRLQSETDKLGVWMRSEYAQKGKERRFQVRSAVRLRAQGQGITGLLLHKLEDFKVTFLTESRTPSFSITNKAKTLRAYFQATMIGSSSSRISQVQAYFHINCCTVAVSDLLKFFKGKDLLQVLHGFSNMGLCQAEGWRGLELPLIEVTQGKRQMHIAWQIGETQLADEEGQEIIETGFSLDQGERNWQRLVKYYLSKKGYIEIYAQSYQEVGPFTQRFFSSKFTGFEKLLLKKKVIDK